MALYSGFANLALQRRLEETQWWPPPKLLRHQFRHLDKLIAHARRTVPFYQERLAAADVPADRPIEPEACARIPILTRREVQRAGAALQSAEVPPGHGETHTTSSSGSTGMPVTVLVTTAAHFWFQAITLRNHQWHRHDLGRKIAVIRYLPELGANHPDGFTAAGWGDPTTFPAPTGPLAALSIHTDVAAQLEWLRREKPAYLLTFPTNLLQLATQSRKEGAGGLDLVEVLTMGEVLDPDVREAVRHAWNVPITDMYSAQEVGYVALQCPQHEHYHVQAEAVLVEILDDDGRPSAPGQVGRVVVTPLRNFAMPLLRYELGDYAEPGEPCPCGRGLPVLRRILGRQRNVLVGPNGERHWPQFGTRSVTRIAPIVQHQFVQKTASALEVRLVTERPLTADEEEGLRRHLLSRLPFPMTLELSYWPAIPRSPAGKFEDLVSEVA